MQACIRVYIRDITKTMYVLILMNYGSLGSFQNFEKLDILKSKYQAVAILEKTHVDRHWDKRLAVVTCDV